MKDLLKIARKSFGRRVGLVVGAIAVWCHPPMMPPQDKLWMTCEIHRHRHRHRHHLRRRHRHPHNAHDRWGGMRLAMLRGSSSTSSSSPTMAPLNKFDVVIVDDYGDFGYNHYRVRTRW